MLFFPKIFGQLKNNPFLCNKNKNVIITNLKTMDVLERLQSHHIKPSVQRIAIMDYLMKHRTHPTVDEIYIALSPSMPTLSKTTVYNTLKLLTENGAIQTLTIDGRNTCYDAITTPHAHFFCKCCGRIYDLVPTVSDSHPGEMEREGHQIQEIHHYYKGICKHCMQEKGYIDNN